ncbi:HNH endonuclease signature motif containing protein [Ornithinimicrobium cryptoxanthini]|uniref:HNH endonuclease n=1 Tax=Ornithinimicrobium cryptoxanthini TaxID=2934161 RepID=A0ABY4YKR6_9MICO|nr:HNH endonuclease signature motif containing protein [Ornithinimicrobium cryptoxanthini]USQ77311.1 HNH endonuclease [Ornithinimicrobium cryptoxanthini]
MARFAQVLEACGGGESLLEARVQTVLAEAPKPTWSWEVIPLRDREVVIEFVPATAAETAVARALAALGVAPAECDLLTDLAGACAAVNLRGAPPPASTGEGSPAGTATPGTTTAAPTAEANAAVGSGDVVEEAPEVKGRASVLVDAIGVLSRGAGRLDRVMVSGTRELTAAQGKLLLADKGVATLDELSASQTDAWRVKAKSRARTELEFVMGWGVREVRDLVNLATQTASVRSTVGSALASGEVSWRLVRGFLIGAGHLPPHLGAGVANALFGSEEAVAATERLTSDRQFTGRPWAHKEFYRALDREVAKAEAHLEEDERRKKSRSRNLSEADTWGRMDEDGTAVFGMRCTATQLAAISDRLDGAARRARANGDARAEGQIRAAVAAVLLLNGTVPTDDWPEGGDQITPEQTEQLAAILAGLPAAVLNVIVPLNFLHPDTSDDGAGGQDAGGQDADGRCAGGQDAGGQGPADTVDDTQHTDDEAEQACSEAGSLAQPDAPVHDHQAASPDASATAGRGQDSASPQAAADGGQDSASPAGQNPDRPEDPRRGEGSAERPDQHGPGCSCGDSPDTGHEQDSAQPGSDPDREGKSAQLAQERFGSGVFGIGEVAGRQSVFLSPQEVARLALTPGSVMHRLVTDPLSGRCLERSTKSYPFTAAMKAQIAFADRMCRAPGCTVPAAASQFDHVTEHGTAGGHTCEANGALAHPSHHDQKTKKYLDVVINHRREMTWETLLGKIYRTKAHDYTQYSTMLSEAVDQVNNAAEDDRGEAIDLAIYQALSYRPGRTRLTAGEDEPFGEDQFLAWDQIRLTRRDARTGRILNGPTPDTVTAERDRHTRATPRAEDEDQVKRLKDGDIDRVSDSDSNRQTASGDQATAEGRTAEPKTPGHVPWSTPDDTPPPF